MPDGYGVPGTSDGLLDWSDVEARLTAAPQYWLATTRPDGRPHVVPRWGVWVDGRFWYDGAPTTVHVRNLAQRSACTLHLEDGWKAVIVEGTSQPAPPPGVDLGARLAAAFADKYADRGYEPQPDAWEGPAAGGLVLFTPIKALAWFDFPTDVTRFRFRLDA
ncbi:MAG: pyridoxamine 5'-phosphate oxidase family protein [Actinomycetota bacterium]|nr:pyridoxamine 5'-phosphate oxidase family protein [Actinomycetota bacterium]MDQ3575858.1 pyridoxamine 5'-phosphate oxidase family protein [Actinomycetota bacterium]